MERLPGRRSEAAERMVRSREGRQAVIGGDDDGAAVVEAEVAQAIEQRPHHPQRALRLRQVARAGQPQPPAGVDALRIGGDGRVRRDQVQERVHGGVAGGGDPTRELLQKHRVPERAPRRRHRTPAGLDPLLEQPSIVPVDARLDAVRRVPEQRQVEQLGRRAVDVVAVAAVRRGDRVPDGALCPGEPVARVIGGVGGQGPESIAVPAEGVEDRGVPPGIAVEPHLVAPRNPSEHRRHAPQRAPERAEMLPEEGEPRPSAIEGRPVVVPDLGEDVRREHVEHDVDEIAVGGELVDRGRGQAPALRRAAGLRPGRGRRERRQEKDRGLQPHQERARRGRGAADGAGEAEGEREHADPQGGLERDAPGGRRQVEAAPVQQAVVRDQQVSLRPEQYAGGAEPGGVAPEPARRQEEPDGHQQAGDEPEQPNPARRQTPERRQELGPVRRMHRPRPEQQDLGGAEEGGERHDPQARAHLPRGQRRCPPPNLAPQPGRRSGGPDEQHRPRQLHRRPAKPVAERAGVGREETAGADGLRLAARRRRLHVEVPRRPALPVVDLQGVRAGLQRHAAHLRVHADGGMALEHDLAVYPHDHAVVGAGAEIDPLRARREPDAAPTDEVVAARPVELFEEGEVDAGGGLLDDREHPGFERARVGVPRERIVVAAREPAGRREAARQEPDQRQQDGAGEIQRAHVAIPRVLSR